MDITLFELHVDDASFTAHAPFSGSRSEDEEATVETEGGSGGRGRLAGALFGLGLLAVLVWVRRRGAPGDVSLADAEEAAVPE